MYCRSVTTARNGHVLRALAILVAISLPGIWGCAPTNVQPIGRSTVVGADDDERTLIRRADEEDEAIRSRGLLLPDEPLQSYLAEVGNRLVPDFAGSNARFGFLVLRDPMVNAFAMPNGSIYVNVGLLARLQNEAQLAHVLAHEISHVTLRHSLKQYRSTKNKVVAAHLTDVLLGGTSIAYLPYVAAIAGYSRDAEQEADMAALTLMSNAGYRLEDAYGLFAVLAEVNSAESLLGSIYASHPGDQTRIQYTRRLIEEGFVEPNPEGVTGTEEYNLYKPRFLDAAIDLKLRAKHYQLALNLARQALEEAPDNPRFHYYRGEALRLAAGDPEGAAKEHAWIKGESYRPDMLSSFRQGSVTRNDEALTAYRAALALGDDVPEVHRGLGLIAYSRGERPAARSALSRYLDRAPDAKDELYIKSLLEELVEP